MASRSLRVEFVPAALDVANGTAEEAPVHDVSIDESVVGVPRVLENPHVDFPGTWQLVGEGADGAHRYQRVDRLADTSDTVAM